MGTAKKKGGSGERGYVGIRLMACIGTASGVHSNMYDLCPPFFVQTYYCTDRYVYEWVENVAELPGPLSDTLCVNIDNEVVTSLTNDCACCLSWMDQQQAGRYGLLSPLLPCYSPCLPPFCLRASSLRSYRQLRL